MRMVTLAVMCFLATTVMAADLELRVLTGTPVGNSVDFVIDAQVTASTQGLALFSTNVTVTGPLPVNHSIDILIEPEVGDIATYFVRPGGLTNPAGFGGTPTDEGDSLLQVGGGQNTVHFPSFSWPISPTVALDNWTTVANGTISSLVDGVYTITLSSEFGNVLTYPIHDYWGVDQATISNAGSNDQFTIGSNPCEGIICNEGFECIEGICVEVSNPTLTVSMAYSAQGHGIKPWSMIMLTIPLMNMSYPVDPRLSGISQIRIEFDQDMDAATLIADNISVTDENMMVYGGSVSVIVATSNSIVINLGSVLEDKHCYTFDLDGMKGSDGDGFRTTEEGQVQIIALAGDVNRDGGVTAADNTAVKQRLGLIVTADNAPYDVNNDGGVTTADNTAVKQRLGISVDCFLP